MKNFDPHGVSPNSLSHLTRSRPEGPGVPRQSFPIRRQTVGKQGVPSSTTEWGEGDQTRRLPPPPAHSTGRGDDRMSFSPYDNNGGCVVEAGKGVCGEGEGGGHGGHPPRSRPAPAPACLRGHPGGSPPPDVPPPPPLPPFRPLFIACLPSHCPVPPSPQNVPGDSGRGLLHHCRRHARVHGLLHPHAHPQQDGAAVSGARGGGASPACGAHALPPPAPLCPLSSVLC